MPELPEVEIFKRRLDPTALGRRISGIAVRDKRIVGGASPAGLMARLKGARLAASRRHGKYLPIDIGEAGWFAMHFGMNGSLQHFRAEDDDPPYDRLRFDLGRDHHLAYLNPRRLGRMELVTDAEAFVRREGLGADALYPALGPAEFARRVAARKREIKSVLMDQTVVAGIGNIYSDEILFQAGLHPRLRANRLDRPALARLFAKMQAVLRTAIRRGAGSEQMLDRLPRGFLLPQRKKGGRCPRCKGAIAMLKFSGRSAYCCPRCQPSPR